MAISDDFECVFVAKMRANKRQYRSPVLLADLKTTSIPPTTKFTNPISRAPTFSLLIAEKLPLYVVKFML